MSATNVSSVYMQLTASELSAIIIKGYSNWNDRDAGFCSGSSDGGDDLSNDHSRIEPSSPTDASEDSVEVKVTAVSYGRNKRKSSEPSKVVPNVGEELSGPLKKRTRYTSGNEVCAPATSTTWNTSQRLPHELMPNPAEVFVRHPGVTTLHLGPSSKNYADDDVDNYEQEEPLALVLKKPFIVNRRNDKDLGSYAHERLQQHNQHVKKEMYHIDLKTDRCESPTPSNSHFICQRELATPSMISSNEDNISASHQHESHRPQQRNYKNMTRERRIEANARERTRVHTISAAYETLRKAVPSYSNSQKLSKLSVLRVACSYILTLSRMVGEDYSEDQSEPSIASCIEAVSATIQTEGKIRKKKDD